jgi:Peptidase family M48
MIYWLLAAIMTLCTFGLVAAVASAVIGLAAPFVTDRLQSYAPASRAALLFRLRMLPAVGAGAAAFGVALPVFLVFEPVNTNERVAVTLVIAGLAGASIIARGACRAIAAWRATRAVSAAWQRRGRRLDGLDVPIPAYAVKENFPTVAIVGCRRPILFVAECVLRECSDDEVRAMVSHECAHLTAGDNLKRFLIRACPDMLRRGGALERAWSAAAEEAADSAAAAAHPAFRPHLAQALIRVARLAPIAPARLASAFYLDGSIESRVRRLVDPAPDVPLGTSISRAPYLLAAFCAIAAVFASPTVYRWMETVIQTLP